MGMNEKEFQGLVVDIARTLGWLVYHTFDSRRSEPGFPDLVMVRGQRVVFAELKADRGRLSEPQKEWLSRLTAAPGVEAHLWRPGMHSIIIKMLGRSVGTTADAEDVWNEWESGQ